jgi:hypothetical protein
MFRAAPEREYVQVDPSAVSVVYQSVNSVNVLLPGESSAMARAAIVGYKLESKRYAVVVALHLVDSRRHLIFVHDNAHLDPDGARQAAGEAISFVESMGFFVENSGWKDLDRVAQRELLAGMLVFQPPAARKEQEKVVDPRTKLARLLVQF